jgi:hypothetical protein
MRSDSGDPASDWMGLLAVWMTRSGDAYNAAGPTGLE